MKKLLLFFSLFLISFYCMSQKVNEHVMVSSGNTIVSPEMTLDWVVGENIIEYEVLFNLQNQKEVPDKLKNANFKVYPTITSGWVNVLTELKDQNDLYLEIFDLTSKRLKMIKWVSNPQKINLETFSPGMHFIRITKKDKSVLAVFKIILK